MLEKIQRNLMAASRKSLILTTVNLRTVLCLVESKGQRYLLLFCGKKSMRGCFFQRKRISPISLDNVAGSRFVKRDFRFIQKNLNKENTELPMTRYEIVIYCRAQKFSGSDTFFFVHHVCLALSIIFDIITQTEMMLRTFVKDSFINP